MTSSRSCGETSRACGLDAALRVHRLLGDWNWYLPSLLEWLPKSRFEGATPEVPADPEFDGPRSNGSDTDEHQLTREPVRS